MSAATFFREVGFGLENKNFGEGSRRGDTFGADDQTIAKKLNERTSDFEKTNDRTRDFQKCPSENFDVVLSSCLGRFLGPRGP